jgi:hypothetical protein
MERTGAKAHLLFFDTYGTTKEGAEKLHWTVSFCIEKSAGAKRPSPISTRCGTTEVMP